MKTNTINRIAANPAIACAFDCQAITIAEDLLHQLSSIFGLEHEC
jgi:hypothetical protein